MGRAKQLRSRNVRPSEKRRALHAIERGDAFGDTIAPKARKAALDELVLDGLVAHRLPYVFPGCYVLTAAGMHELSLAGPNVPFDASEGDS